MMSAIKSGAVSHSRFAKMAEMDYKVSNEICRGKFLRNVYKTAKCKLRIFNMFYFKVEIKTREVRK